MSRIASATDQSMLRSTLLQVLDALSEVAFWPEFLASRIEKERKAVLAEAQMMNTIEYRVDCALLKYLHQENALGCRFPIGKTEQVRPMRNRSCMASNALSGGHEDIPEVKFAGNGLM